MHFSVSFLVSALLGLSLTVQAESASPLLAIDFEKAGRNSPAAKLAEHPLLEIVPGEGVGGTPALKATYEGYERGSRRLVVRLPLEKGVAEATLSYDVRFAENFQFVGGGKLHGLGPARPVTGGNAVTEEGWSARVNFGRNNSVRTYMYVQDKPGQWGQSQGNPDFRFDLGRYYAISFHVKLNSADDVADGFARIYINGTRVVDHANIRYRATSTPESLISEFLFSTFHGGNGPQWAPRDEQGNFAAVHAFFDNIVVYPGANIRGEPGACWKREDRAGRTE